jgi:hypothetical protein
VRTVLLMRRPLLTASFTVLLSACATARPPADSLAISVVRDATPTWQPFRSAASRYDVEFPAEPEPADESWTLPGGSVAMVGTRFADASYLVSVVEAREAFATPEARASALEAYPAELVQRLKGAVVSDERRDVAGWPARSVEIAAERGVTRVLVVPTPERLYLVGVATRGGAIPGEAQRFLGSFRPE